MSENHGSSLWIKNGVDFVVVGAVDDAVIHCLRASRLEHEATRD